MGKIYNALRKSGVDFDQESVSKKALVQSSQITKFEIINSWLIKFGLGKDQISQQSMKELNKSLHLIDDLIAHPESLLKQSFTNDVDVKTKLKQKILPILLERKMFVLRCGDEVVDRGKINNLRNLIKRISDRSIRSSLEKIIDDLQMKNSILAKEYQKLENTWLNCYYEQDKFSPISEISFEKRNKTSKYFLARESTTTFIMGILLILITLLIAISPFVHIQVPAILNSAFLIILGFFFGQSIGRFASSTETKKTE